MDNEKLADFIHQGGNDELIPVLWEKVRKLVYMLSEKFYRLNKDLCDRRGVDIWDIKQESYTAYLYALKSFDISKGYKFTTYLELPLKNAIGELLGRSRREVNEPLNTCKSLDKSVMLPDGKEVELFELVPDKSSLDFVERMETLSEYETIHKIVDNLPEPCKSVINRHYFQGVTFTAIADEMGFSKERIRQIHLRALKILRNNKDLQEIYGGYKRHYNWTAVQSLQNRPEYFGLCSRLKEKRTH